MRQPRVRVRAQGLGLVPAQGPQVRPVLRGFRRVAVVLAFIFTLLFHMTLIIVVSPTDESFGEALATPGGNRFGSDCTLIRQVEDYQSSSALRRAV